MYAISVVGGSVSEDGDDVSAINVGGRAFGVAPRVGLDIGGFRLAGVAHLIIAETDLEPIFSLEMSWRVR